LCVAGVTGYAPGPHLDKPVRLDQSARPGLLARADPGLPEVAEAWQGVRALRAPAAVCTTA
jgi:hypothetical protein